MSDREQKKDHHRNPRRVMVDIETLGLDPGAVIVSIGAVAFGCDGTGETFYRSIDRQSCEAAGLHTDEETLKWWQDQGEAARDELEGGEPLGDVLEEFARFYGDAEEVWANSPSFDCEHLSAAFDAVDIVEPWEFYHERDFRTLKNLPGAVELKQDGDAHHALDDAMHQAEVAAATLRVLHEQTGVSRSV